MGTNFVPSFKGPLEVDSFNGRLITTFSRIGLPDGVWIKIPSIFRLRLTGTGSVTLDARNALNEITTEVASFSASSATNQIEFPYPGDDAIEIRATYTGTCVAEII